MTDPRPRLQASPGFWHWLARQRVSLAFTTYQTNRLFLVGRTPEPGRLALHERLFDKPMGLFWQHDTLTMGCRYQIWQLDNRLAPGASHEGGDRLYVPRQCWITGDVNAHDLVIDGEGRVLFVNTDFSCLATLDPDHSFVPLWQPPFITRLAAEDRCHLNGLALQDGAPTWMTACSRTDTAAGWRHHRHDGGCVLHLPSNTVAATGLSMPHSPRWYRDRLWLLDSGNGALGYLDEGRFEPVADCPGFARGLAFHGDFALVGLSRLRERSFGGLALEQRLAADGRRAQCGLAVIDLVHGQVLEWLRFDSVIEELFDLVVIPEARQPRALGLQDDTIERLVSFPGSAGLVVTKPTLKRPGQGAPPPTAGLPRAPAHDPAIRFQQVHHLSPDNLAPYAALTWPRLDQRWHTQPPDGEIVGVSAVIGDALIGLAVAECRAPSDHAELISLFVLPEYRGRGVATRMLAHLRRTLGVALREPGMNG
ncbi:MULTISPECIES: TIGR03032 family protein [Marichromatium]|uniref:Uncharacterized protein (TIGR03032 family) n=1 Tax=Marichromatium gracile TaxID=1048 RepID=A0A4R4A4Q1_MARGR|nr:MULTISPECIES: TIGR03032 family protein [Marichromatium]MBK1710730.1 TIGR03032 family protein [Marichromatium gracile]MBO8085342.1 TIGR03032 family protein [Marichromatium sp.]RNE89307.1 TIGR03032 family protein [Marichromatium sp. AB32]TCW33164.1 uncharacterized protein (TIGR03032 family) [Marichromatium gracile]